jgi:hypothetical protein
VLAQGGDELAQQERVAARRIPAGARERVADRAAGRRGQHALHPGHGQRGGQDALDVGVGRKDIEDRVGAGRRPGPDQERDGERADAAGEVGHEPQRRLVGPLRVVDDEDERAVRRRVDDEPVEAVEDARAADLVALGKIEEHAPGQPRRPGQQPLPGARVVQQRFEGLARDTQREVPFEFGAPRLQHPQAAVGGARRGDRQQ